MARKQCSAKDALRNLWKHAGILAPATEIFLSLAFTTGAQILALVLMDIEATMALFSLFCKPNIDYRLRSLNETELLCVCLLVCF